MRTFLVSVLFFSLSGPALSAQVKDNAAEDPNIETSQNTGHESWTGRHHYLYDDEYRPETTGAAPSVKGCTEEIVRLQRSDGKSTVKRINRCD